MMSIETVRLETQSSKGMLTLKRVGSWELRWHVSHVLRIFPRLTEVRVCFRWACLWQEAPLVFFVRMVKVAMHSPNIGLHEAQVLLPKLWRLMRQEPFLAANTSPAKSTTGRSSVKTSSLIRSGTFTKTTCARICTWWLLSIGSLVSNDPIPPWIEFPNSSWRGCDGGLLRSMSAKAQ